MTMGRVIEVASRGTLALCALAVTVMMTRNQFHPPARPGNDRGPVSEADWRRYAVGDMRIGPANAAITITEFSDFQCPYCRRLYQSIEGVREHYPRDIAVVYRNYPLDALHPHARPAAMAAECAAQQGRFAEYYRTLFDHQDSLASAQWVAIAARVGVADTSAFVKCLRSPSTMAKLRSDSLAASALRIPGTPVVLVNEWMYRGALGQATLERVVASEMKRLAR